MLLVLALGLSIVLVMATLVLLGVRRSSTSLRRWLIGGFVAYGLVFVALARTAATYAEEGPVRFIGGFPLPTALVLYGVWLFPWVILLTLVVLFEREHFTPEDEKRFEALLKRIGERQSDA